MHNEFLPQLVSAMDLILEILQDDEQSIFPNEQKRLDQFHSSLSRANRLWRSTRQCVVPGCTTLSIKRSHTMQRKGPLALLAENGHVCRPFCDKGKLLVKSVGVGEASTFPGFCTEHEGLFKELEAPDNIFSDRHMVLQTFRTICREVVRKRADVLFAERMIGLYDAQVKETFLEILQLKIGFERFQEFQPMIQHLHASGPCLSALESVLEANRKRLTELESLFLAQSFAEVNFAETTLAHARVTVRGESLPVCLAGTGNFFAGRHEQPAEVHDIPVILNIYPTANATHMWISALAGEDTLSAYMGHILTSSAFGALAMAETWMIRGSDHWFMRPSVWNQIPADRQDRILSDLQDTSYNVGSPYSVSIFDAIRDRLKGVAR